MTLSPNAIQYAVRQLFAIAMPGEPTPTITDLQSNSVTLSLSTGDNIYFALLEEEELQAFMQGKGEAFQLLSADGEEQIPVFGSVKAEFQQPDYQEGNRTLRIPFDFISVSFLLLSREEEYHDVLRDVHNRFQYTASLACQYRFIGLPLVDEYAMLLRQWILRWFHPQIAIRPRQPQIIPTHDIDLLYRFYNPWQAFRSIFGRDLLLDRSLSAVKESLGEYREWKKDTRKDPYIKSILQLIQDARQYGQQARFFFKGLTAGAVDTTYDVFDPNVRYCIDKILENDMLLGVHGSYESYDNIVQFGLEKENLERVSGLSVTSCRQHYLRFNLARNLQGEELDVTRKFATSRTPDYNLTTTLQVWKFCGIRHDYTLGYAEQPGFRCSTCHPYPLYDLENDCPTEIIEHPLIVMDGSLFDHLKLDIEESLLLMRHLYRRCQAVEGDFIILWHNHTCCRQFKGFYQKIYLNFMESNRNEIRRHYL